MTTETRFGAVCESVLDGRLGRSRGRVEGTGSTRGPSSPAAANHPAGPPSPDAEPGSSAPGELESYPDGDAAVSGPDELSQLHKVSAVAVDSGLRLGSGEKPLPRRTRNRPHRCCSMFARMSRSNQVAAGTMRHQDHGGCALSS
jgi:hypothetical protein